ncbi:MAG: DNA-deoxyinosine glycosylase [Pyramidobacter sp.]|nr:DNA-deoxyinosine glycosylase [Pyramidobacter sp.]
MLVVHPLEPIFNERSRALILGTMPSPKSREARFYYAHPQNRFWRVLAAVFDSPLAETNDERRAFVLSHRLALWDVLKSCEIAGASDASIKNAVANDLSVVLCRAPIRAIFCTGTRAAALYRRLIEPRTGIPAIALPSTSPANCAVSFERLCAAYGQIRECVQARSESSLRAEQTQ